MPGFAAPAWLLALAALALPVVLHLWSRRPQQVVRIGSLRNLGGPQGPRAWGRRLEDLPLLGLRLGILTVVALALAGLRWHSNAQTTTATGTVVVADPANVGDSLQFFADPVVDSLRRAGTPIRLLLPGLPRLGADAEAPGLEVGGLWSRLNELDRTLPPGGDLLVFATPHAGNLGGARPHLSRPVRWHDPGAPQTTDEVVAHWRVGQDTMIQLMEGRRGLVSFRHLKTVAGDPVGATLSGGSKPGPGSIMGQLTNRSVTIASMEVIVDQRDTFDEAAAIAAFSAAIETATGRKPVARVATAGSRSPEASRPDLIIWLSGQSVSGSALSNASQGTILIEFTATVMGRSGPLTAIPAGTSSLVQAGHLLGIGAQPPGVPLLSDQYGQVIASVTRHGAGRHVRVATRLDPAWSDLALGPALPELAYWLVTGLDDPSAQAPVSVAQAVPEMLPSSLPGAPTPYPLVRAALVLAGLLFVAERLVVHARQRTRPA